MSVSGGNNTIHGLMIPMSVSGGNNTGLLAVLSQTLLSQYTVTRGGAVKSEGVGLQPGVHGSMGQPPRS